MWKICLITNNNEIIAQIFWKNPKYVILINIKNVTGNKRKNHKTFFYR